MTLFKETHSLIVNVFQVVILCNDENLEHLQYAFFFFNMLLRYVPNK